MNRVLLGAIAGAAAALPMTMAMRHGYRYLRQKDRYPLPPREIIQQLGSMPHKAEATIGAHFTYGAVAGIIFSVLTRRRSAGCGALFGALNWVFGYFGWTPLVGILKSAHLHPVPRSLLMFVAHLVWGGGLAVGLRELEAARDEVFRGREMPDAPDDAPMVRARTSHR